MNEDWSNWHFFEEGDVMGKTISQLVEIVADTVLEEAHKDIRLDFSPSFDFDDEKRGTQTVYISAAIFEESGSSVSIEKLALDAVCDDAKRARFISDALRAAADKVDKAFPSR